MSNRICTCGHLESGHNINRRCIKSGPDDRMCICPGFKDRAELLVKLQEENDDRWSEEARAARRAAMPRLVFLQEAIDALNARAEYIGMDFGESDDDYGSELSGHLDGLDDAIQILQSLEWHTQTDWMPQA